MAELAKPDDAAALAAARRLLPGTALLGEGMRIWRQRPAAEPGMLDTLPGGAGWAFVAWSHRAVPLGLLEWPGDGAPPRAQAVAEHPWLAHALLLGLAQASLPHVEDRYLSVFEVPGGVERALVADCLDHELVVPLHPGAELMHGLEFAAWLHRLHRQEE